LGRQAVPKDERVLSDVGLAVQDVEDRILRSLALDDLSIRGVVFSENDGQASLIAGDGIDAPGDPSDLLYALAVSLLNIPLITICPADVVWILGDWCPRANGCFDFDISKIFVVPSHIYSIPSRKPRRPHVTPATISPREGRIIHAPVLVHIIKDTISRFAAFARFDLERSQSNGDMDATLSYPRVYNV
jgi:hypothetical protein